MELGFRFLANWVVWVGENGGKTEGGVSGSVDEGRGFCLVKGFKTGKVYIC